MPQFGQISPAQTARLIGTPDCPTLFDVRLPDDLDALPAVIPTAILRPHDQFADDTSPPRRAIVICMKGRKLSEGVAAILRSQGWQAEVLEGGAAAWAEAGLPMTPRAALPPSPFWVTRHRPKIDRIACPWLIRRFIDPAARFLFVTPAEVPEVAGRFNAIPFDVGGTTISHRDGGCSFDALLDDFALHSGALDRLALVVRGADTDRHGLAPQAAGLLALSVGLSRMFRDDLQQLEAGMTLYDALYRWARDGFDEGHDWPAGHSQ
ncbi:MAG: sulfurtransferase/chromate resistance protein [Paracoccaceae bacterium]